MSLKLTDVEGFEVEWLTGAFQQAANGVVDNVYLALQDLTTADHFWLSWDAFREGAGEIEEGYLDSDEFFDAEVGYLTGEGLADHEIVLMTGLLHPLAAPAILPGALPDGATVRAGVNGLVAALQEAQGANPKRGGFLRALGRGILILAGASVIAVDAAVAITASGLGKAAVASMYLGMKGIAAGTFDDPQAARSFAASGSDR